MRRNARGEDSEPTFTSKNKKHDYKKTYILTNLQTLIALCFIT